MCYNESSWAFGLIRHPYENLRFLALLLDLLKLASSATQYVGSFKIVTGITLAVAAIGNDFASFVIEVIDSLPLERFAEVCPSTILHSLPIVMLVQKFFILKAPLAMIRCTIHLLGGAVEQFGFFDQRVFGKGS